MKILGEHHDEINRRWCEESVEDFKEYWRGVLKEAS